MEGIEKFLGKWVLAADQSQYELGEPPKSGTYEILKEGQLLTFKMAWTDSNGENQAMAYSEVCDGEFHDYPVKEIADEICLSLRNDSLLVSEARKNGTIILSAKRQLVSNDEMEVTMSGTKPDGEAYTNRSWYTRKSF